MKIAIAFCLALTSAFANAATITDYKVLISSAADGTLTVRTITTWDGSSQSRDEFIYSPEAFIQNECNAQWTCQGTKGSSRSWYLAFEKPKGYGFVLIKVGADYEDNFWRAITLVDHDGGRREIENLRPGCQDIYSDGRNLIIVEPLEEGHFDRFNAIRARERAYDPVSGLSTGSPASNARKSWKLLAENKCGLKYLE